MLELLVNWIDTNGYDDFLSVIWDYWRSGGWLMIPLGLVCLLILYGYLAMRRRLKYSLATPAGFLPELRRRLENGKDPDLLQWLDNVPGAKAHIVHDLLVYLRRGLPFGDAYRMCRSMELTRYAHSFTVLSALVMAAPLLGLLGTVLGMIGTFEAVAHQSSETTQMVAGGISQALITTQAGLVAALPGTFGIAHLHRLYKRLRSDIDGSERHLSVMLDENESELKRVLEPRRPVERIRA